MQRKVFDSSVSAILDNLSKLNDDFAQDTSFPDTPKAKSHVETYTYVVQEEFYGQSYDFYGIVDCGQFISHLPKYVYKKFTKL